MKDTALPPVREYAYYLEEKFLGTWTRLAAFNDPENALNRLRRYRRGYPSVEYRVVDHNGEVLDL